VSAVGERLAAIEARIAAAARRVGRDPATVRLVGASKQQSPATMLAAHAAGLRHFGENRVQEARAKQPALPPDIVWHLLGPLQSNKVRAAIELFTVFHAVDRTKIARALDAEAAARGASSTACSRSTSAARLRSTASLRRLSPPRLCRSPSSRTCASSA
jgi:PLP dependent protein